MAMPTYVEARNRELTIGESLKSQPVNAEKLRRLSTHTVTGAVCCGDADFSTMPLMRGDRAHKSVQLPFRNPSIQQERPEKA
jgi:hypothetical protein